MNRIISTLKHWPHWVELGGDEEFTQSALILASQVEGETRIRNFNRGRDTDHTLSFLKKLGYNVDVRGNEIFVSKGVVASIVNVTEISYEGSLYPLCLIIGLLAGRGSPVSLEYSGDVNADYIEYLIGEMRAAGAKLSHKKANRTIKSEAGLSARLEKRTSSAYPYLKDCLLMLGVASERSVAVREEILTDDALERLILRFGGKLSVTEARMEILEDPNDPRKKIRREKTDYRRELMLHPSTRLAPTVIEVSGSLSEAAALITLAVLKNENISLEGIVIDQSFFRYLNFLKAVGIGIKVMASRKVRERRRRDISMVSNAVRMRKVSGEAAAGVIKYTALVAILAATAPGTTIIRDIKEYIGVDMDPLHELATNLDKMGVKCGILDDGLVIEGKEEINGADFGPFKNKDIALAFYLIALAGKGKSNFSDFDIIADNYPEFVAMMENAAVATSRASGFSEHR